MAKATEKPEEAATEVSPKSNKKLIIIVAAVAIVLILGGVGGFLMMKKNQQAAEEVDEAKAEKIKKIKEETPPVIVKLDQFTVKLQPDEGRPEQYMQTVIELEVQDAMVADRVKTYMSKIRARLLLLLLGKTPSELSSPEGVEFLAAEIRNEINQILDGTVRPKGTLKAGPDDSVQAVYLTQFIIQ